MTSNPAPTREQVLAKYMQAFIQAYQRPPKGREEFVAYVLASWISSSISNSSILSEGISTTNEIIYLVEGHEAYTKASKDPLELAIRCLRLLSLCFNIMGDMHEMARDTREVEAALNEAMKMKPE